MIDLATIQPVLNQLFAPAIADQLNQRVTLLSKAPRRMGGGKNIAWDVKVGRGTSAGSYADGAVITGNDNDIEVPAILQWKRLKAEFKVTGTALAAAASGGPEAYAQLLGKNIMDAARNLAKNMNSQLYGDGTGNGGLDVDGLAAIVLDSGTYAGVSRVTYPTWRGTVLANGGVPRALTSALMMLAEKSVFVASGEQPDFIITSPGVYAKYEALFGAIQRVVLNNADSNSYDLGAMGLDYKGIPIIRDAQCPTGTMYFLKKDAIAWEGLTPVESQQGMQLVQGHAPAETQDGTQLVVAIEMLGKDGDNYKGYVKTYGNLVGDHPNMNCVIKDIDET